MSLILIIDDDAPILELLQAILTYEGHTLRRASDGREGLALMDRDVDLLITDLIMPNREGLETIADVRRRGFLQPIIAMTGGGLIGPHEYLETARFIGANAVLAKPFSRGEVLTATRSLLTQSPVVDQPSSPVPASSISA